MRQPAGVRYGLLALVLLALVWYAATHSSAAAADAPTSGIRVDAIEAGFNGFYKVGEWTPVRVTLTAATPARVTLVVAAPDADDHLITTPSGPVALTAGGPQRLEICFKTGRANGELRISLQDGGGRMLFTRSLRPGTAPGTEFHPGLHLDVPLWATLGNPAGLGGEGMTAKPQAEDRGAGAVTETGGGPAPTIVRLTSSAQLPGEWRGYQSLNALVIVLSPPGEGEPVPLSQISAVQNQALREWVQMGGHLVLSAGSMAAYQDSPLAKWVPVPVIGQSPLRQLSGLEMYSGQSVALQFPGTVQAAKLGPVQGTVVVKELDEPLLVDVPLGFGHVTFLGLDANRPPLTAWAAMPAVWRKLLDDRRSEPGRQSKPRGQLSHLGISDLASQLHAAQEDFPEIRRFSTWSVMGLILVYVLVLGPLDYLLVHRVLRRPELTWLTLPLWIGLAGAASVWGAGRLNGDQVRINQLDLIDTDAESGLVRGRTWATLYSPETRRYSVGIQPANLFGAPAIDPREPRIFWEGVPENTVGGLYRSGGIGVTGRSYRSLPDAAGFENLPVQKWSTKSLTADWRQPAGRAVTSTLQSAGPGRLSGSVTYGLSEPLEECLLVYGGRMYSPSLQRDDQLGKLAPHQEWEPGVLGQQRELRGFLTGASAQWVAKGKGAAAQTEILFKEEPYNPLNHNAGDLVRMLSFHGAAGGSSYTGMNHAALRTLELSRLTSLGRAILVGRLKTAVARVHVDGQPQEPADRATYVRFVLPVKPSQPDTGFVPNKLR